MSDENKIIDENEADDLFDEGNIVKMPESDPAIDVMVLSDRCDKLIETLGKMEQQVRDLERQMQQKQYELDLNGGLARLNIAGDILMGYASAGNLPTLAGETRMAAAMRYADDLCTDFEEKMTKRANDFMKFAPMSPSDETSNPMTEN